MNSTGAVHATLQNGGAYRARLLKRRTHEPGIHTPQVPKAHFGGRTFESRRTRTVVAACRRGRSTLEGHIQAGWLASSRRRAPRADGHGFRCELSPSASGGPANPLPRTPPAKP